jgi:hypothetical protein
LWNIDGGDRDTEKFAGRDSLLADRRAILQTYAPVANSKPRSWRASMAAA